MSVPQASFGELLRVLRKARGLTQDVLARESSISEGTIRRLESDSEASFRESTLELLLETLGAHVPFSESEIAAFGEFLVHPPEYYRKFGIRSQEFDEEEWRVLRAYHRLRAAGKGRQAAEALELLDKTINGDDSSDKSPT